MYFDKLNTIVIKIGSSLIINEKKKIRSKWLDSFVKDIQGFKKAGKRIIIVSSGAIALGCKKLNLDKKNLKIDKSQAVASIGQIELMNLLKKNFSKKKMDISQILITLEDTEVRRRAINARRTLDNLFDIGFIPVVNENDSIATSEIKYGDNDRLASRVAQISNADCLILLSDVGGLYNKNPKFHKDAKLIKEVKKIDENVFKIANKTTGEYGSGGMLTKIEAAKICGLAGCKMVISSGLILNPLKHINLSKECTWFLPEISKLDARKKWIASSVSPKGELMIDNGAIIALKKGKSLLAAGIKNIKGNFDKGDHIKIVDEKNFELGRGLSSFSSEEISKIKGQHSDKINKILGYKTKSEVVHKDDMVGFSK